MPKKKPKVEPFPGFPISIISFSKKCLSSDFKKEINWVYWDTEFGFI